MAQLSHADFARQVLAAAAPPERVAAVIAQVLGDKFEIGPLHVGPAGIATATVVGTAGFVDATTCLDDGWDVNVAVPVSLSVWVRLAGKPARYRIALRVRTRFRLVLEQPCTVVVDFEDVRREHIDATVNPHGMPSRLIGWVGKINTQVGDQVVAYFNHLIASPEVFELCHIDVQELLRRAWASGLVIPVGGDDPYRALEFTDRAG
jgi:hypothetical protein